MFWFCLIVALSIGLGLLVARFAPGAGDTKGSKLSFFCFISMIAFFLLSLGLMTIAETSLAKTWKLTKTESIRSLRYEGMSYSGKKLYTFCRKNEDGSLDYGGVEKENITLQEEDRNDGELEYYEEFDDIPSDASWWLRLAAMKDNEERLVFRVPRGTAVKGYFASP